MTTSKAELFSVADPTAEGLVPFSFVSNGKQQTLLMEPSQLWFIEARAAAIRTKLNGELEIPVG